jgi:hypothetical protein
LRISAVSTQPLFADLYEECLTGLVEARKQAGVTQTELAAQSSWPRERPRHIPQALNEATS